jgi:hypothetical protein
MINGTKVVLSEMPLTAISYVCQLGLQVRRPPFMDTKSVQ